VRVLVLGAAGMLGRKLAERLALDGELGGRPISVLTLADVVEPDAPDASFAVETSAVDVTDPGGAAALFAARPDVVFHLAAVVSGEAEADLEKGYRVNLDGTRLLLDAARAHGDGGPAPRVVFSSSIAVFGPPFPHVIGDAQPPAPLTSYGTQKAMAELLLADYSRRGFVDGVALRLPTICVRPGGPNRAASGFFSNIVREPLQGQTALLPVPDDVRHWFASPRAAVGFLLHAATLDTATLDTPTLDTAALGAGRALTMPGVSATVGDEIAALERVAGRDAARLIVREPDEAIARIVAGWPGAFETRRADALGFRAERDFDEIIRVYIEDELGGLVGAVVL
jgi:nucleoside-diphosphate-sugar epimerase